MINDFNDKLDKENEVGLELCNFGQKITYVLIVLAIGILL